MWVRRGSVLLPSQPVVRPRFLLVLLALLLLGLAGAASAGAVGDYPSTVLGDGPVAYWRLGEASGTVFADSSGHGYDLTLHPPTSPNGTPGTYAVAGDVNPDDNAYQFNFDDGNTRQNGTDFFDTDSNLLTLAPTMKATVSSGYPSGTNSYSFEAWVKPQAWNLSDTHTFPGQIVDDRESLGTGCGGQGWNGASLYYQDSPGNPEGAFVFERDTIQPGPCTAQYPKTYSAPVAPEQWYYVVGTYDGQTLRLYVDGTLVTQQPSAPNAFNADTGLGQFQVGSGIANDENTVDFTNDHFKGTIDEAAVYDYALSGSQIQAHYAYGLSSNQSYSNPAPIPPSVAPVSLPPAAFSYNCSPQEPSEWLGSNFWVENYQYYVDEGYVLQVEATSDASLGYENFSVPDAGMLISGTTSFGWRSFSNPYAFDGEFVKYVVANDMAGCSTNAPINLQFRWVYVPPLAQENGCDAGADGVNDASFFGDVNSLTGAYATNISDVKMAGLGVPLSLSRCYSSAFSSVNGPLGRGWKDSFSANLSFDYVGNALFTSESGQQILFYRNPDGSFTAPDAYSTLSQLGDGSYRLTRPNQTSYHFDSSGNPLSETDRNGEGLTFNYSGGQLSTVSDQTGRSATLGYTSGLLTSVSYSDGRSVSYGYTSGYLTSVTDVRGKVWHYAYDANGRLASIQDPNGHYSIRNTYDAATGRVTSQLDALDHQRSLSWGGNGTTLTDPNGKTWTDTYKNNELVSRTDPLGNKSTYTYDPQGNRLTSTDADGNTTTYTYDSRGNMLTEAPSASLGYQAQSWTYDSANDVLSHTDSRGHETDYTYDPSGNLTSIVKPGSLTTTYNRDPSKPDLVDSSVDARNGNLASATDADGNKTTYSYDDAGDRLTVTSPRGNVAGCNCASQYTTTYTYDAAGHKLSATDPLGNETTYSYDDAGNLSTMVSPRGNVQGGNPTNFTTSYTYDNANELTDVTRAGSQPSHTSYNSRGLVTSKTSPLGRQTTYGYDDAGRLTSVVSPNGNVAGCNCASQYTTSYSYDAAGHRTKLVNPLGGVTDYAYDALGRLTRKTVEAASGARVTSYSYDANGNLVKTVDPMGRVTTRIYDANNRLSSTSSSNAGLGYAQAVTGDTPSAYLRLDESAGATAANLGSSGSAENGTYSGTTLGQAGALTDDSDTAISGGSVSAPTYPVPNCADLTSCNTITFNGTLEGWFNRSSYLLSGQNLYVNGSSSAGYGLYEWTYAFSSGGNYCSQASNGFYYVGVWVAGDSSCVLQTQVSMNRWHHIVLTHTGPAGVGGTWKLYVDGNLRGSVTSTSAATGQISAGPSGGNLAANPANYGSADEIAFYQDRALGAGQIVNHYAAGLQSLYAATTLSDGPASYWRLDESSGTTAANLGSDGSSTIASTNGSYSGATLAQAGALAGDSDTALSDGTVSGTRYALPSTLTGSFNISFEGWFKRTSQPSSYQQLFVNGDSNSSTGGYGLYAWSTQSGCSSASSGNYMVGLFVSGVSNCALQTQVSLNAWHQIALTHSGTGSSGTWSLYVDGSLASSTSGAALQHVPSTGSLVGDASQGTIDELAFYTNVTLSANQIANHYQAGTGAGVTTRTTSYSYDANGNLESVTDPRGGETTYVYDDAGLLTSRVSPLGNVSGCGCASQYTTSYGYDADGNQQTVTDPLNHTTTTHYNADQQPINRTDAAGRETQWQYDPDGNPSATIANDNSTVKDAYNALNQLTSRTTGLTSPSDPGGNTTSYYPDADGMLSKVVDPLGDTTTYTYDANGNRLTSEDAIANAAQNPSLGTTTYTYNALDEPTQVSYSDGTPTASYSYDAQGDLLSRTDSTGVTSYGYNPDNQVTSAQTGSNSFSYGYDSFGELNSETYPNGAQVSYGYDNNGNLNSLSSSSQTTNYVYDPNNQLTSESLPNGYTTTLTYDNAGQLASTTNAKSGTTLSSYAVTARYNDGAPQTLNATNNGSSWVENYTYDQDGRLASVCYQASCPNGSDPKIGWAYDASGNRTSETRANGVSTTYTYNTADELKTAAKTGPGIPNPYSTTVPTDGASPYFRLGETSGSSFLSTPSGFTGTWTGSPTLNVTGALNGDSNGAAKLNGSSQYGSVPNATAFNKSNNFTVELWIKRSGTTGTLQAIAGKPLTATTKSENYAIWLTTGNKVEFQVGAGNKSQTLDSSGTITDTSNWHYIVATFASGVMKLYVDDGTPTTVTASFTSAGTNTSTFDIGRAGTTNYYNGSVDELALYPSVLTSAQVNTHYTQATSVPTTTTSYTYNKDGEETAAGNASYSWNLAGELTTATIGGPTSTYTYDGAGMRTSAATGGPTINYTWDEATGGLPTLASETDGSGNPLRTYLYGASTSPIAMTTPGGSYYDSYDAYGNVADQTSSNGTTQWAYNYEPFGLIRNATNVSGNAPTNPYQYAGQYTDTVTALSDMRARTYDPNTGSFLTTDPAGQSTPQVNSQYAYTGDLPLMYIDPSGLFSLSDIGHYIGEGLDYLDQAPSIVASAVNNIIVQPTIQTVQNDLSCISSAIHGSFSAGHCIEGAIGTALLLLPEARFAGDLAAVGGGLAFRAAARAAGTELGQAATSSLFRLATEEAGSATVGAVEGGTEDAAANLAATGEGLNTAGATQAGATQAGALSSPLLADSATKPIGEVGTRDVYPAGGATNEGTSALGDAAQSCSLNSFTARTRVLLADGRQIPISKVKPGMKVLASDPATGTTAARRVDAVVVHSGKHTMVDLAFADGSNITATDRHPFWDASTDQFTYAINLHAGEQVHEADGHLLTIAKTRTYTAELTAYNLTIDGIHTYYAGTTPVLVHNSCGNPIEGLPRSGSGLKVDVGRNIATGETVYPWGGRPVIREFAPQPLGHGFPDVVDNFADSATHFPLRNGVDLYQLDGSFNGVEGRFEWIVDQGAVTHRMFVGGGAINGIPIVP
jgi:RHS repeat-associated protein